MKGGVYRMLTNQIAAFIEKHVSNNCTMVSNYWTLLFYELRINLLSISLICSLARYLNIIRWI